MTGQTADQAYAAIVGPWGFSPEVEGSRLHLERNITAAPADSYEVRQAKAALEELLKAGESVANQDVQASSDEPGKPSDQSEPSEP